jgi:glycosyltransferase involved in cell wall biosynthesis
VAAAYPASQCFAVPVNDIEGGYDYPDVVRFEIEQDLSSPARSGLPEHRERRHRLHPARVRHLRGPVGSHLLALLRELRMPVVTTFHTILLEPNGEQRRVMQELITRSTRLVVMADRGRRMLQEVYQAPSAKIDFIPHGIPDIPFVDPNYYKDQFGVEGRMVLLTFGLLSPNKGIENVLHALPAILAEFPDVVYVVVGATHPNEVSRAGRAYRLSLERLAKKNKVDRNVIFYNRFVDIEELEGVHRRGRPLHHPVPQRGADHLGDARVRVRLGEGGRLDALLVCRRAPRRVLASSATCRSAIR